ncbi:MAG TPA: membrane protein insertase YidC [Candidatus Polarisedimenticolaceae bacterium]|nr:membrane protein insertase YidC [Candidatus Polarisedimenticolaceae bacterium]
MERHHIYAALAFLALIAWFVWFAPKPEPMPPRPAAAPTPAAQAPAPVPPAAAPPEEPAAPSPPAGPAVAAAEVQNVDVETAAYAIRFTNQGASVLSWRLKDFHDSRNAPVELVPEFVRASPQSARPLQWDLDDTELTKRLNSAPFAVERERRAGGEVLRFRYADGAGLTAEKTFTFPPSGYTVGMAGEVVDRGRHVPARLTWGPGLEAQDMVRRGSFHYGSQLVRNVGGRVERLRSNKVTGASTLDAPGDLRWAGLEDQYFAALLLPGARGASRAWPVQVQVPKDEKEPNGEKEARPFPVVAVSAGPDARLFVGPKSYTVLREAGLPPLQVIWFSNFGGVDYLAELLLRFLLWLHSHVVANWGLVIVLATFCLRLVLFPLNQYSMVKMRKAGMQMQRLKPRMDSIKNKYAKKKDAENRAKMNKEIMELYAKEGINPLSQMSGCLPILIQFPVLIAFYNVFTVAVELRGAPFAAWIKDLSLPDPIWITPLLMGATMFYQQKLAMQKSAMDPTQARMMMFMPLIFTVTFLSLPSGLVLYWLTNNVLGIAQQWLVNRHIARIEPAAQRA